MDLDTWTLESLGHSAIAYDSALERLERKFGGERWLFSAQMEKFEHFPVVKAGDSRQLEKLADLLDLTVINLKDDGFRPTDLCFVPGVCLRAGFCSFQVCPVTACDITWSMFKVAQN